MKPLARKSKHRSLRQKLIKEADIDKFFSLFIRNRDIVCQFPLRNNEDYHAGVLQNSHFYGRTARSVRWDEDNCDALCARHHQFLEERKNAEYEDFKLNQLGAFKFAALKKRYYSLKHWTPQEKRELYDKYKMK